MSIVSIVWLIASQVVVSSAEAPSFSLPAAELRAMATAPSPAIEPQPTVRYALETFDVDATGKAPESVWHAIYTLDDEDGVEELGRVAVTWSPWAEARPVVAARVVNAAGREHVLDVGTLIDGAVGIDDGVYSDRHRLQGPLPGVGVGAVVEIEVRRRDLPDRIMPYPIHQFALGSWAPSASTRFTIATRKGAPLHTVIGGDGSGVVRTVDTVGNVVRTTFALHAWPGIAEERWESMRPDDMELSVSIMASTTATWREVAAGYAAIVEQQLKGFDGKTWLSTWSIDTKAPRDRVLQQILDKIAANVRYTGLEIGDASLTPRRPDDTLGRGFGDCKDLATLAVGLFRAAGIGADVALIRASSGIVKPAAPGSSRFDHAIVVVGGKERRFIDVTNPGARAADVESNLQGKDALVASSSTKDLVRLPIHRASDNRYREVRTVVFGNDGDARITEDNQGWADIDMRLSSQLRETEAKARQKEWQEYADDSWLAHAPVEVTEVAGNGAGEPYRFKLSVPRSGRALTQRTSAIVYLVPRQVVLWLPELFVAPPPKKAPPKPWTRLQPLQLPMLMDVGVQYRIKPPAGFALPALAPPRREAWGPATYTEQWSIDGGDLVIDFGFVIDQRVLSPTDVVTLREKVQAWLATASELVTFPHAAAGLIADGRVKEGIAAYRAVIDAQPTAASERERLAEQLFALKFGDAARREARMAAKLEPKRAASHALLGWLLAHDDMGVRRGPGADERGAIAALRTAVSLDGADAESRRLLAELLSFDRVGRYRPGLEALRESRTLLAGIAEDDRTQVDIQRLLSVTVASGDVAAATSMLSTAPEMAATVRLWGIYAEQGAARARATFEATMRDGPERKKAFTTVGGLLLLYRRYDDAAIFMRDAPIAEPAMRDMFAAAKPCERIAADHGTPEGLVRDIMRVTLLDGETWRVRPWLAKNAVASKTIAALDATHDTVLASVPANLSAAFACDISLAMFRTTVEGNDDVGYVVRLSTEGDASRRVDRFFVVKEDGRYRLLASGVDVVALGGEIFRRAQQRDGIAAARTWLARLDEVLVMPASTDPLAGAPHRTVLARSTSDDDVRFAAALLGLESPPVRKLAIPLVVARLAKPAGLSQREVQQAQLLLAGTLIDSDRPAEALPLVEQLLASPVSSSSTSPRRLQTMILMRTRRAAEVEKLARARLQQRADDNLATNELANALIEQGRPGEALSVYRQASQQWQSSSPQWRAVWNNLAWTALFVPGQDLALVEKDAATAAEVTPTWPARHTLATVQAARGDVKTAMSTLADAVAKRDTASIGVDWLVVGLAAEAAGMHRYALTAYQKLLDEWPPEGKTSSSTLAATRVAALQASGYSRL